MGLTPPGLWGVTLFFLCRVPVFPPAHRMKDLEQWVADVYQQDSSILCGLSERYVKCKLIARSKWIALCVRLGTALERLIHPCCCCCVPWDDGKIV